MSRLTMLKRLAAVLLTLLLSSCGGGGSDSGTSATPTTPGAAAPVADATLKDNVRVLTANELGTVRSETPGSHIVLSAGLPSLRVGDIAITTKTALVVTDVSPPAGDGSVTVRGRVPELEEVFKTLKIYISDYALSPSQFTPADGVTVVASTGRAVALGAKPLAAVKTNLSLTLSKKLSPNLEGLLALSMAPSVDYMIDHDAVHGTIAFRSPITVTPKIAITGKVGFKGEYEVGSYSVPIVTPFTPAGMVALKVPIVLTLNAIAGQVSASIGVGATADYGVTLIIEPYGLDLKETGTGFTFTSDGTNISSFDLAAAVSLDVRVKTGVSLTAFFGSAEPISALVSAGARADLLNAKLSESTSTGASDFNLGCMTGTLNGVADAKASAKFFGFTASKATTEFSIPLAAYSAVPGCTAFTIKANPSTIFSGQTVEFTATMPHAGLFPAPPTGTVAFSLASGEPLCTQALDVSGNAKCSAKVNGALGSTVPIEALYLGSSKFAGGLATGAVSISSTLALELAPVDVSLEKGSTIQISVVAKDSGGNVVPTPAGLQWAGDSKVSVSQNGLVTANLAGDGVVRVTDPVSKATAQVTIKVYGLHPFNYYVFVRNIKCGESVALTYSMNGGGDSFGENFSYTAVPCVPVALDTFAPRIAVPKSLRASTKYTLTMTAAGSGFLPNITDAFVEFDSTLVGFAAIVKTGIGIPGTYTVEFTTPP